jgi:sugar transferase (PEP-CTERM/EpsH1 system associated)
MNTVPLRLCTMPELLFLAPCLPYPPDRGDRLRWYHMLRFLSLHYRVHVGCIADPHCPPAQLARIKALCYETCFVAPPPLARRMRAQASPAGLDGTLAQWVSRLVERTGTQAVLACSAHMGAYLSLVGAPGIARVADYVDVESDKRGRRAAAGHWPARLLAQREARRLQAGESTAARHADHVLFASPGAATLFCEQAPAHAHKVLAVPNGVDAEYFSPHIVHRSPFGPGCRALVFAGAMDDWANAEAAEWFARHVFARLRAADPALHFYVVGARPGARVQALARASRVVVTGAVPDLRPFLAHAALVVAPLQSAHGIQNKVLEAMAMQQAVLATPAALSGLSAVPGAEVLQAADAGEFAATVSATLVAPASLRALGKAARACVLRDYSWPGQLEHLKGILAASARLHAKG